VGNRLETLVGALPQHLTAPAQLAADELGRKPIHDEPRHFEAPAVRKRPELALARIAFDVADLRIPVVAALVDEAEAQPNRIGKIDAGYAP